jgi:hypothetical protein
MSPRLVGRLLRVLVAWVSLGVILAPAAPVRREADSVVWIAARGEATAEEQQPDVAPATERRGGPSVARREAARASRGRKIAARVRLYLRHCALLR